MTVSIRFLYHLMRYPGDNVTYCASFLTVILD